MRRPLGAINLTRAPGSPPTGQIKQRPGTPILPSTSLVLLNQQLAIDPYHPSAISLSGCRRQLPIDSRLPDSRKLPSSTFDENSRSHRCCMGLRPLQRLPRTAVLENEGCRPQFQQDCGPAECQHCRAGVQPFGFACLRRLLDGWYWRLPPRPRLR